MKHLNAIRVLVNPHVRPGVMILRDQMLFLHTRILHDNDNTGMVNATDTI